MNGIIYFLTNRSMPGLIKIGFTLGLLDDRVKQLNTTGVPLPFEPGAIFKVYNAAECERSVHIALENKRVSGNREFFNMSLTEALNLCLPVLAQYMDNSSVPNDGATEDTQNHALDPSQVIALTMLAHDARTRGMCVADMIRNGGLSDDELTMEYKIAILKDKGIVEELKQGKDYPSFWRITSKGIRFMFDNDLILKNLLGDETEK
jgi:hypothetical protein